MQIVSLHALTARLAALPGTPRVVASGNFAAPVTALGAVDKALESYRLYLLNAHPASPTATA
jgi:hypothetical protein